MLTLLALCLVCSGFAPPENLISGASATLLSSSSLSDGLNQNKSCCINYSLLFQLIKEAQNMDVLKSGCRDGWEQKT